MKHPSLWTRQDLHKNLQHAIDLELWTIPLYLSALYSIKGLRQLKPSDYPDAAKLILSVVVQEMLHLELVCNLCNALGYKPRFKPPVYDEKKGIPFIHPKKALVPEELRGYEVKIQALNKDSLKLFCAIEMPHPKTEQEWVGERSYNSIAELYDAIKMALMASWDRHYVGDSRNTKQKDNFNEYHNHGGKSHGFSQVVDSPETAARAIDAIVSQGEGADSKQVPADFRPPSPEMGDEYMASWYKGNLSHYQKFRILLLHPGKIPDVHTAKPGLQHTPLQETLKAYFEEFLYEMEKSFSMEGKTLSSTFHDKMFGMADTISALWEAGVCPEF